jgi:hypothetical protein
MPSKRDVALAVLVVLFSVGVAKGRQVRSNLGLGIGAGGGLGTGLISVLVVALARVEGQVTAPGPVRMVVSIVPLVVGSGHGL